jgi:uncharacterized protein YjiS (DUF1127 family)
MYTTQGAIELKQTTASVLAVAWQNCWRGFQQWHQRSKLIAELHQLDHRELADLGISRGDIGYVAAHFSSEPRSILPDRRD